MPEPSDVALARAVLAHFDDRRHQPLLDSERRLVAMAHAIVEQALGPRKAVEQER